LGDGKKKGKNDGARWEDEVLYNIGNNNNVRKKSVRRPMMANSDAAWHRHKLKQHKKQATQR
jgi:hypothetical protein